MRKLLPIVVLFLLVTIPCGVVVAASQQAYQDYLYQFDLYRQKYSDFQVAKNEYQKFKSLTSQTQALEATKTMLAQRDQLLHAYLVNLGEKVNEEQGLSAVTKGLYRSLIQSELTFLERHSQLIPSINSIDDAITISQELESHYQVLQTSMHQIIAGISLAKLATISQYFDRNVLAAQTLVNANTSAFPPGKLNTINRWLLQIQNKRSLYQQKVDEAAGAITGLTSTDSNDLDQKFNTILKQIGDAKQYLSDGISFLGELANSLRYID